MLVKPAIRRAAATVMGVFLALQAAAQRNEGFALPGLMTDPPGSATPKTAAVSLSAGMVIVRVAVAASPDNPGVLIKGPDIGLEDDPESRQERHFPELKARLDGDPAEVEDFSAAFAGKRNITATLRAVHFDIWSIDHPTTVMVPAADTYVAGLIGLTGVHAIEKSGDGYLPKWTARRGVRIPLKPGAEQTIELRFPAWPAFAAMAPAQIVTSERERDYCVTDHALRHLVRAGGSTQSLTVYEYVIAVGIDGQAPSSTTIEWLPGDADSPVPQASIFLCGPHRKAIAGAGTVKLQPAQPDEHGLLRLLSVAGAPHMAH